ncbi:TLC domain-containing protein [Haematococcus lacustris]|uniref:TLC domain-containing protein n=1 Tax=Haematococcus lacustris TaxID=44745 RepID=A0A6A0ACZ5_HAELA|nr:TLC domain-containing protein [Haematococcus lacustris]
MILRTSPSTYLALGVSFGYFVIDFWTCVKYNLGGTEMVLHHLGSLLSVTTALVTGDGHMHTLWMLVTEFTTPLINNRWWLDKMVRDQGWIFARLLVFPPFFWIVWQTRDQVTEIVPLSKFLLVVVPIILTFLNLFWFYKIVKGAMKILTVPAVKKTSKAE